MFSPKNKMNNIYSSEGGAISILSDGGLDEVEKAHASLPFSNACLTQPSWCGGSKSKNKEKKKRKRDMNKYEMII